MIGINELKDFFRPFQCFVRLYLDSNSQRGKMKDDNPFRHVYDSWILVRVCSDSNPPKSDKLTAITAG